MQLYLQTPILFLQANAFTGVDTNMQRARDHLLEMGCHFQAAVYPPSHSLALPPATLLQLLLLSSLFFCLF